MFSEVDKSFMIEPEYLSFLPRISRMTRIAADLPLLPMLVEFTLRVIGLPAGFIRVDQRFPRHPRRQLLFLVLRSVNKLTNEIDAFLRQARRKPQT